MIFYFSATGNSKYVAQSIANNEKIISISDCIKNNKYDFEIGEGENIGIISPTYFWGIPSVTADFLKRVNIKKHGNNYTYYVATYGTTTGQNAYFAENILKEKNISFDACYSVKMPDTWTVIFDLSDKEKVALQNEKAITEIKTINQKIKNHSKGDFITRKVPKPLAAAYYKTYSCKSKTSHFTVSDSCVGCGMCERKCPVGAIKMQNKKPEWIKENCAMCLGCLHRCPKFAIQYGNRTQKHGQYQNPQARV